MNEIPESGNVPMKTCSMCNKSTSVKGISLIHFGEWMTKKEVTVHYYCLLLSTNLPQRGEDHSGILGFLLRDIRLEIFMAKKRKCMYCFEMNATIQCDTCKKYFHITCGHTSKCLSQFVGKFKSYCHGCLPVDQSQKEMFVRKPPLQTELCFICAQVMGTSPKRWIYAKCCGNGYTHSKCMKIYALSAGYYLTCIWCKDKSFRENVKYMGVFVPDREANWEKEKGAYGDLYRRHKRCDMDICNCPRGRDYTSASKWQLIICKFCGAFGAHNPACIPGVKGSKEKIQEFKCDVCSVTERTVLHKTILGTAVAYSLLDKSLYVNKETSRNALVTNLSLSSNNSSCSSTNSLETVVNVHFVEHNSVPPTMNNNELVHDGDAFQIASAVYTLTQSPQVSQQLEMPEFVVDNMEHKQSLDSEDDIADFLVQQLLNIFDK